VPVYELSHHTATRSSRTAATLIRPSEENTRLDHAPVPDDPVSEEPLNHIYVDQLLLNQDSDALEEQSQLVNR
jgi:hypothetical protein